MKKIFLIALTAVLSVMSANAQDNSKAKCCNGEFPGYWYVQFQGGIHRTSFSGNYGKQLSPAWSFGLGRQITPVIGARLNIEGVNAKNLDNEGSFKYATGSFDVTANLVNLFTKKCCNPVNFSILGGVGTNWSEANEGCPTKFSPNFRLGAIVGFNLSKYIDLSLEYRANTTSNYYDGVMVKEGYDWYQALYAGITIKFPTHKKVVDRSGEIDALNKKINALMAENEALKNRKPEVKEVVKEVVKTNTILPNVFFQCAKSNITLQQSANVRAIADFMKANPNANIKIKGYASPEGNAQKNQKLSEDRANAVADMLVKKYGIAADRISTEACGPTNEVYPERNLNRVAVSVAK